MCGSGQQAANFAANAVDNDAAHSVGAHQLVVILAFEPGFTDDIAGPVFPARRFNLVGADLADISTGVSHESAGRVTAPVDHEHFQRGQVGAMRFDESDIGGRCLGLDDDGLETRQ